MVNAYVTGAYIGDLLTTQCHIRRIELRVELRAQVHLDQGWLTRGHVVRLHVGHAVLPNGGKGEGRKVDCGLGELLGAAELRCLVLTRVQALSVDSLFVAAATSLP